MIPGPPDPRRMLSQAGLRAKGSWGQNFLLDQAVLLAVARATGAGPQQPVVELGAGLGALTYYLARAGGPVLAVERDRDLVPLLRQVLGWAENLEIVEADAASVRFKELAGPLGGEVCVAGNLPYQLSSRILVHVADQADAVSRVVVMVQREVAERLLAEPGTKAYGLLSVLVGRSFAGRVVRQVPPGAFHPPPKVSSTVVCLERLGHRLAGDEDTWLVRAARAAFAQKRKTLRNSLKNTLQRPAGQIERALGRAGLQAAARAETLSLEEFRRLGRALFAPSSNGPQT